MEWTYALSNWRKSQRAQQILSEYFLGPKKYFFPPKFIDYGNISDVIVRFTPKLASSLIEVWNLEFHKPPSLFRYQFYQKNNLKKIKTKKMVLNFSKSIFWGDDTWVVCTAKLLTKHWEKGKFIQSQHLLIISQSRLKQRRSFLDALASLNFKL